MKYIERGEEGDGQEMERWEEDSDGLKGRQA